MVPRCGHLRDGFNRTEWLEGMKTDIHKADSV